VTPLEDIRVILATDCGSTTTKAILIQKMGDEYRQTHRGEAPTTVEAPFEDVTLGVLNAVTELAELSGRKLLDAEGRIIRPTSGEEGCDLYISTSSAGGGLQMMVAGVVRSMTAESAERAALGAGSIVMDVIALNDRRMTHERIERIRQLRPDMILIAGEVDGARPDKGDRTTYSTYLLGHWVREEGVMSLEDAVYRMTGKTALMHDLHDRGFIQAGKAADITIFDPDTIQAKPREWLDDVPGGGRRIVQRPVGVKAVFVNGEALIEEGEHTGARPGKVLPAGA